MERLAVASDTKPRDDKGVDGKRVTCARRKRSARHVIKIRLIWDGGFTK